MFKPVNMRTRQKVLHQNHACVTEEFPPYNNATSSCVFCALYCAALTRVQIFLCFSSLFLYCCVSFDCTVAGCWNEDYSHVVVVVILRGVIPKTIILILPIASLFVTQYIGLGCVWGGGGDQLMIPECSAAAAHRFLCE